MKTKCLMAILVVAFFSISACTLKQVAPDASETVIGASSLQGNAYFHYLEAELYRKKGKLETSAHHLQSAIEIDPDSIFLKRELAVLHFDMEKTESAVSIVENILARTPDDVETLELYAKINQRLKREAEARGAYEKIITLDPENENAYITLGRMYMADNDLTNAQRVYTGLVGKFPASFVGHFFLGKIYAAQGDGRKAEASFEKTLQLEPGLLEPRFELIRLYQSSQYGYQSETVKSGETVGSIATRLYGRYDTTIERSLMQANPELKDLDAVQPEQVVRFPWRDLIENQDSQATIDGKIIRLHEDILEINPGNVTASVELGLYYLRTGRTEAASGIFYDLGKRTRTEKAVMTTIIQKYFENKQYGDIKTILEEMLKAVPGEADLHYVLGLSLNELEETDAALGHFEMVDPASDFYENAAINIAFIYQQRESIDQAIHHLEEALEKAPGNVAFMYYLGTFYEEEESFDKAEEILKRGIEIDADNPKLHFRLGVVYDKMDRKDACIASMKATIRIDPDHANALNYLGYTYAELGQNLEEAEEMIRAALKQRPDDGYITDSLAWIYYKKGMYGKALEMLEKAVRLVPDDPVILEHLGDVHLKLDDPEKALEFYRRSLDKKKKDSEDLEKKIRELTETGS